MSTPAEASAIIQRFQTLGPAISLAHTRELDVQQFKARISDPDVLESADRLLGAILRECHARHGVSSGIFYRILRLHNTTVFLLSYLLCAYEDEVFDDRAPDRLRRHLVASSRALAERFDAIVAACSADAGFADVPVELTRSFADEVFAHEASYDAWSTFDARRLVGRIRNALSTLYEAMWIAVDDRPELVPAFDRRIVQLRGHLARMDRTPGAARAYLADEEMRRMRRVVLGLPPVLGTLVGSQVRARVVLGLRRTRAARRKLVVFRLAVDRGGGPAASLSFELFAMVAGFVLA